MVLPTKRPGLKILHTADVHLDCDRYGQQAQRETQHALCRQAFQAVVNCAIDEAVDLVLIAGDLFDHNRVPDETVAFVQDQFRRLSQPVIILPGNHDCLYTGSIYDRHNFSAACENVQVITHLNGQAIELPELHAVIWGRAMEEHEPGFHPLAHIPTRLDQRWHIAMAHGFFFDTPQNADRSSPIFAEEIRDTGWDYVAMGHVHVLRELSQGDVTAYYSGASLMNWGGEQPQGHVLLLDCTPTQGIIVRPRPLVL